jgi:hypothetical protein
LLHFKVFTVTHFLKIAFVAIAVLLTGCAANVQRSGASVTTAVLSRDAKSKIVLVVRGSDAVAKSADWPLMREEWRAAMSQAAAAQGLAYADQPDPDKTPRAAGAGTLVTVMVNDYRYVATGTRYGLGVFTGNAFVNSEVTFADFKTGRVVGSRKYDTSSSAMQGVFSAMTSKQVQGIATEIVKDVSSW